MYTEMDYGLGPKLKVCDKTHSFCSPGVFGVDTDEVKSVSVMKGDSVSLNTGVTETQKYLLIQWMFGSTRIAEVNKLTQANSTYDGPDGRFRDRLKLDQTGSLTITNTRTTDSGLYQLAIVNRDASYINYNVTVFGKRVTA